MSRYPRLHPELLELREEHLEPAFVAAVRSGTEAALRSVLRPVAGAKDLFTLPVLTRGWCERLHAEVRAITTWTAAQGLSPTRPNSMNRYGLVLDELGYEPAFAALVRDWLQPFGALLYPEVGGATLDDHHAFVVQYDAREDGGDVELGFHVDQSDVTLNLCLGGAFEGGELYFRGRRCALHQGTPSSPAEDLEYEHLPGVGLLHAGKHRHGAHPITSGARCNLIVWCMSSSELERQEAEGATCRPWCAVGSPRASVSSTSE